MSVGSGIDDGDGRSDYDGGAEVTGGKMGLTNFDLG